MKGKSEDVKMQVNDTIKIKIKSFCTVPYYFSVLSKWLKKKITRKKFVRNLRKKSQTTMPLVVIQ